MSEHKSTDLTHVPRIHRSSVNDFEQGRQTADHGPEKRKHAVPHDSAQPAPEKHACGRPGPARHDARDRADRRPVQPPALHVLLPERAAPRQLRVGLLRLRHLHQQRAGAPGAQGGSPRGARRRQVQPGARLRRGGGRLSRLGRSR